ncbi:GATA transcription factor 15-like [Andrographis paniculata]|uniref:GATA transcription factor 15-like n=1 Tax=Andrographis paniculata TaxID=175694 RepID=UPI0021E7593B|nr:GATA transcription factor 15-like [Andrographis paniculata]
MADRFRPSNSRRKEEVEEEYKMMDLTLRLGTPKETSGTAADQPPSLPSLPPPIMYNFFSAVAVGGGVAIGPAAIIPVVAVPFPQGFVPVYRSPRKRPNPDGQARNENRVCENCGTRRTPLWRKGPKEQTNLCNACGLRNRRN